MAVLREVRLPALGGLIVVIGSVLASPDFLALVPAKFAAAASIIGAAILAWTKPIHPSGDGAQTPIAPRPPQPPGGF